MNNKNIIRGVEIHKLKRVFYLLGRLDYGRGVLAAEITQESKMPRRTVNRYLEVLGKLARAKRIGWHWFADGWTWPN